MEKKVKYPAASYGASNLQRSRAAGYLTLAAFAKYPCKHGYLAHCFAGINDFGMKIGEARKDKKEESKGKLLPKMNNLGNFLLNQPRQYLAGNK